MAEDSPKKPKPDKRRRTTTKSKSDEENIKPKTSPRRRKKPADYNDDDAVKPGTKIRRRNGILLASIKPSYCSKLSIGSGETIQSKHKKRLRELLKKLILRHDWVEASGVLSVLLKSTPKDKSIHNNRIKYGATLELVKRIQGDSIKSRKIENIYDMWLKKSGPMKNWTLKDRFAIQVEYTVFCLTHGKLETAYQAALGLMQDPDFEKDPISNFIVGLTFYASWYSSLPIDWKITETYLHSEAIINMSVENSVSYEDSTNSISSVAANYKDDMEVDSYEDLKNQTPSTEESGDEESYSDAPQMSIFYTHSMPPWLLPLRMPSSDDINLDDFLSEHRKFQNDSNYKNALKHLRQALHSTPPVIEAFHPLIQMLLLGDKVKEAFEELENPLHDLDKALKLRLKVGLLEHFDGQNYLTLCACYEEILEVDPTDSHSLTRLMNMNHRGEYSTEKLVNMIALHLDATYPESKIWKEFASCLLKLSVCARDQMSTNSNGSEKENKGYMNQIPELSNKKKKNQIPELFIDWTIRCRWWSKRHFSPTNISIGDLELLYWKAACATFLYGREFGYVVKVIELLQKEDKVMHSKLQMHIQSSIGFYNVKAD